MNADEFSTLFNLFTEYFLLMEDICKAEARYATFGQKINSLHAVKALEMIFNRDFIFVCRCHNVWKYMGPKSPYMSF